MHINIELAQLSEQLLVLTIVVYAIAMLAYACDFAFGRQRIAAPAAAKAPEYAPAGAVAAAAGQRAWRPGRHPAGVVGALGVRADHCRAGHAYSRNLAPRHLRRPGSVGQHV